MCAQPYQIPWDPHGLYHARFFLSMWFPSLEYWSGLPYPPTGDLPAEASMPGSPTLAAFLSSTLVFYHWAKRKILIQITNTSYPTWNSSLILTLLFLVMFPTPNSLNKVINDLLKVKTMNFHYTNMKSKLLPIQEALNDLTLGEGNGNPLQYSCLEKSKDRGDWRAEVHGITWLSMCARGWREMGW